MVEDKAFVVGGGGRLAFRSPKPLFCGTACPPDSEFEGPRGSRITMAAAGLGGGVGEARLFWEEFFFCPES